MARILMVGIHPEQVDFSDPALPPGMNAAMIHAGIVRGVEDLRAAGHAPTPLLISPDPAEAGILADKLAEEHFDCVTIGGGVVMPPRNRRLFEVILNIVAAAEYRPRIALVSRPDEAPQAVARVLEGPGIHTSGG